ncbi:Uncharacterized protein TCM_024427 [Theobroma cacao]|uniref:Uncharacterized protein n=1 Tax=Theobroma cacao TaxID=3641 RepID=A0A061EXC1_THECC|nr:Uncharacterized protein TCM_024427 [Theobroma cacao]
MIKLWNFLSFSFSFFVACFPLKDRQPHNIFHCKNESSTRKIGNNFHWKPYFATWIGNNYLPFIFSTIPWAVKLKTCPFCSLLARVWFLLLNIL